LEIVQDTVSQNELESSSDQYYLLKNSLALNLIHQLIKNIKVNLLKNHCNFIKIL